MVKEEAKKMLGRESAATKAGRNPFRNARKRC